MYSKCHNHLQKRGKGIDSRPATIDPISLTSLCRLGTVSVAGLVFLPNEEAEYPDYKLLTYFLPFYHLISAFPNYGNFKPFRFLPPQRHNDQMRLPSLKSTDTDTAEPLLMRFPSGQAPSPWCGIVSLTFHL